MNNEPISREAKLLIQLGEMGGELWKARDWVFRLRKQRAIARNFGNQMERERDEARAWSARWKNAAKDWRRFAHDFWRRKRVLAQERDEAREAFAVATSNCVDAQQRLREMEDQRDFAMSEMERLKQ